MGDTQTAKVTMWLKSGKTLTSQDAWKRWGVTRLSAIIFNLRRQGYTIETSQETGTNRYGEPVRYGRYILHEEDSDEKE